MFEIECVSTYGNILKITDNCIMKKLEMEISISEGFRTALQHLFPTSVHLNYLTSFLTDAIPTIAHDSMRKCKTSAVPAKTSEVTIK